MFLGIAYYPEHWPRERWPIDAGLMHEANIEAARMGEFAWSKFEPSEGTYQWDWMDEAVETLAQAGVKSIMCTPTATPPAWLVQKHPEILPRDANGLLARPFGARRHYCASVPVYHEYSRGIAAAMAEHYGHNPNVIGWQIDNELANVYALGQARCYCEACRQGFIGWLQARYGSLEAVNTAWGTIFWSQEYTDWDQMVLPRRGTAGEGLNPGHLLDYYRYFSDSWTVYTKLQADALRGTVDSGQWISTNFAAGLAGDLGKGDHLLYRGSVWFPCVVDWRKLSESLDFPAWSSHVTGIPASMCADYLRGIREDGNFAVLEGGGTRMRSYQPVAHGATGLAPFRWRQPLFGAESGVD
jgi:beta-galactosidase